MKRSTAKSSNDKPPASEAKEPLPVVSYQELKQAAQGDKVKLVGEWKWPPLPPPIKFKDSSREGSNPPAPADSSSHPSPKTSGGSGSST